MNQNEQQEVHKDLARQGLTVRHFEGEADYPRLADVFTRYMGANGVEASATVEDIARQYSSIKGCDPYRDIRLVEAEGQTIAYSRCGWIDEETDEANEGALPTRLYWFRRYLVPEWWDKGIERALVLLNEKHLAETARSHDFTGPRLFHAYSYDHHPASGNSLENENYEPVRFEYVMVRPDLENVPDLPLPEGLEVRPVKKEHWRAIWDAEQEAFRDHWGMAQVDDEDYQRWPNTPEFQPDLWQVAWDGDQVAGMIRNFINQDANERYGRQRGYTEYISTRRPWRRRGLARALLARSLRMHRDLGMTEAALSVDTQNPLGALQLYESMGFRTVGRSVIYRKALNL